MTNSHQLYFEQWISKAEEDFSVVLQLLELESPAKGIIGFHCQQAAEKFLKAFLVYHEIDFPKTHNLEYLIELCSHIDPGFSEINLLNLTDFGVEMRYPGDFIEPTLSEIHDFILIIEALRCKSIPPQG